MKNINVTWQQIQQHTQEVLRQIHMDGWYPDYIVGISRGGLAPAVLISQYLEIPMYTLRVSLRDQDGDCETNTWMAEDALGRQATDTDPDDAPDIIKKRILLVDDINDSGATINWIKQNWEKYSPATENNSWDWVWADNVRWAVLYNNENSAAEIMINYAAVSINKLKEPQWIVFPWEKWWHPEQ